MGDKRLSDLVRAAHAILTGEFGVDLPPAGSDDLEELGGVLEEIGRSMRRRFEEYTRLFDLTAKINAGLVLDEVLTHVYEGFRTLLPYDRIGFSLLERQGKRLRAVWARSRAERTCLPVGYSAEMKGSSLETILETRRPRILNDLPAYLEEHPDSDATRLIVKEGIRSSLTCPLLVLGQPIGFIFFSSNEPNAYDSVHVELFQRIASQLSLIVEKSRLYDELLETKRQLESVNRELEGLATRDFLTGIPNRRAFDQHLDTEWRRASRVDAPLSLILIDVDGFKRFNDRFGHPEGDVCLRRVAQSLAGGLRRATDFVARYGGEEFAVVLAATPAEGAVQVAERLRAGVEELAIAHPDSPTGPHVTISAGVATDLPGAHGRPDALLARADEALYEAKNNGRNRVACAPEAPA